MPIEQLTLYLIAYLLGWLFACNIWTGKEHTSAKHAPKAYTILLPLWPVYLVASFLRIK